MADPALRLVGAFVEVLGEDGGHAILAQRGGARGYVHVVRGGADHGSREHRHVAIERLNGTVALTEELCEALAAHQRPNARIEDDPLGYSAGPYYGRFRWGITHEEILRRWGSELAFAREVAKLLRALGERSGVSVSDNDR